MRIALALALVFLVVPAFSNDIPIDFENLTREAAAALGIGYIATGCGFDLDDDLIFGEPEDCTICNDLEGTTQILEDFDNDGEFEVQTYIDSYRGDDNLMCGGPETPCRTVTYAKNERFRVGEGENVFCVRGEFHEGLLEGGLHNGQDGFKVLLAAGMLEKDWEFASNPTMLVGWDFNQNGIYAPVDEEDIADFDGFVDGNHINVFWQQDCKEATPGNCTQNGNYLSTSRWEIAHIRVREYGLLPDPAPGRGLFHSERKAYPVEDREMGEHVWFHDIRADDINKGGDSNSGSMMIEGWDRASQKWMSFSNIDIWDSCGYFMRGGGITGPKEHFLVKNLSMNYHCTAEAEDGHSGVPGWKLWGTYTDVWFVNSFIDQSPVDWWIPGVTKVSGGIMSINTCVRDFYAQGNIFKNTNDPFVTQGGLLRGCQERNGDNINYKHNLIINDDDVTDFVAFNLSLGRDEMVFTKNVNIENNMVMDLGEVPNLKRALHIQDDVPANSDLDPSDSWVRVLGNTIYSPEPEGYAGWFTVGAGNKEIGPDKSHNFEVKRNILALNSANKAFPNYSSTYHSAMGDPMAIILEMEENIWELVPQPDQPGGRKLWKSDNGDNDIDTNSLTEFSAHTGWSSTDRGYEQNHCKVEFEDREHGDLRIADNDTCANGAGANLAWLERPEPPVSYCGDGVCDEDENYVTCPVDCEAPPVPVSPVAEFGATADETLEVMVCTVTDNGTISICRGVEEVAVEVRERD